MSNATTTTVRSMKSATAKSQEATSIFQIAYNATAADRAAVPQGDLLAVNLNVQLVTTTILGALPRLWSLRDEVIAKIPSFDIAQFDKLEVYAKALAYAQTVYLAASTPAETLPALASRAIEIRQQLLTDATALARRGLLDQKRLDDLKGDTGYLSVASDLGVLVRMLREGWTAIVSKSAIQPSELDEAEQVFERITLAYAERTRQSEATIAAAEDRQRAYTLCLNAYDQARRATTYLRWEQGDADKFTPSLWAGRGGRGNTEAPKNEGEAPVDPNANTVRHPVPVLTQADAAPEPTEPGLPGGSPFVNG